MVIVLANSRDRVNAFYFVIVYISAVWLNSMLSLALHDPAPFWIEDDINVNRCRPGYPNPGTQLTIAVTLMLTFFTTCGFGPRACCNNWIKKIISLIVITSLTFTIGYAHLYNGEVGLDGQVLAFLISIWTVTTFHFVFRGPIYHHIRELHEGKTRNPGLPV